MNERRARIDLVVSLGSQLGFKLFGFLILTLLARGLTVEQFGFLMFALATSELLALATEFGSSNYLVREVAIRPERAIDRFAEVLGLRLLCLAPYLAAMAALAAVAAPGSVGVFIGCAIYAGLKDLYRTFAALFTGVRRVGLAVMVFGSHLGILAAGVLLAVAFRGSVGGVVCAYLVAGAWLTVIGVVVTRRCFGPFRARLVGAPWRDLIAPSLPLFGLGILTMIQLRIDVALLGLLRPVQDVAIYEASARLFEASQAIVRPLSLIYLPICAALAAAHRYRDLARSFIRLSAAAIATGVAVSVGIVVAAEWIIQIIYGAAYDASSAVLRIHFAATPFVFATAVASFHATALRREKAALAGAAAGLLTKIVLDLIMIPRFGAAGAAWATLFTEAVTAAGMLALVWVTVGDRPRTPHGEETLARRHT